MTRRTTKARTAKPSPAATQGEGGLLIAMDGLSDKKLRSAARSLLARAGSGAGGLSTWDASGLFHQLGLSGCPEVPSPKTLLMLYAADLAFRLSWEIEPGLKQGRPVVAAPYVQTAMAFGRAAGVDAKWMERLFEFAPPAGEAYGVASASETAAGFPAHCFEILTRSSKHWTKMAGTKKAAKHLLRLKPVPKTWKRKV